MKFNDIFSLFSKNLIESRHAIKPRLHIHDFFYDSPLFTPISHGQKNRDGSGRIVAKSGNIQCHHDSSKNVHDISTVSVRYRYESMTIHDGNSTVIVD